MGALSQAKKTAPRSFPGHRTLPRTGVRNRYTGNEAQCQRPVEQAISEFGKIDILVNNGAYQVYREGIQSMSAEELERTYRTNVFSMHHQHLLS